MKKVLLSTLVALCFLPALAGTTDPVTQKKANIANAVQTYGIPESVKDFKIQALKEQGMIAYGNTNICTYYCEGGCGPVGNGFPTYTCYNVNYHMQNVVVFVVDSYTEIPCSSNFGGCFEHDAFLIRSATGMKDFLAKCLEKKFAKQ